MKSKWQTESTVCLTCAVVSFCSLFDCFFLISKHECCWCCCWFALLRLQIEYFLHSHHLTTHEWECKKLSACTIDCILLVVAAFHVCIYWIYNNHSSITNYELFTIFQCSMAFKYNVVSCKYMSVLHTAEWCEEKKWHEFGQRVHVIFKERKRVHFVFDMHVEFSIFSGPRTPNAPHANGFGFQNEEEEVEVSECHKVIWHMSEVTVENSSNSSSSRPDYYIKESKNIQWNLNK